MRHGYTILNKSVNVLTDYGLPKMAYAQVLLIENHGQESIVCNFVPTPSQEHSIKNAVLKKLKAHLKRHHPKTRPMHLRLLHDNAATRKARTVTEFLDSEKLNVLPHSPFSPDLAPCDYFLFPKLKFHPSGKRYISQEMLLGLLYISSSWVWLFMTMNGAFKIGLTA